MTNGGRCDLQKLIADKIEEMDGVDDTYHIERMCELDEIFRKELTKKQERMLDALLTMHAAVEQRSGRAILQMKAESLGSPSIYFR